MTSGFEYSSTATTTLPHEDALADFVDRVRASEVTPLQRLVVFGSVARGTHTSDSDIDVLAIITGEADEPAVEERLRDIAYDVMLDHGVAISIHGVSESTLGRRADHPFFKGTLDEGEPIYG